MGVDRLSSSLFSGRGAVDIAWGLGIFLACLAVSFGLVVLVIVRLPADHFIGDEAPSLFPSHPPWKRTLAHIAKNIAGVLLIALGVVLSLPGVPGQGVLTILIGITLVDFPGKRRFEQRMMRRPALLHGANAIRRRFGKAPFVIEPEPAPAQP